MAGFDFDGVARHKSLGLRQSRDQPRRSRRSSPRPAIGPTSLAKELLRNKTNTIGVMLPRIDLGTFAAMFDGIEPRAQRARLRRNAEHARRVRRGTALHGSLLRKARRRCVVLRHRRESRLPAGDRQAARRSSSSAKSGAYLGCSSVFLDSFNAAKAMVSHLISLGHHRIGCLAVAGPRRQCRHRAQARLPRRVGRAPASNSIRRCSSSVPSSTSRAKRRQGLDELRGRGRRRRSSPSPTASPSPWPAGCSCNGYPCRRRLGRLRR